MRVGASVRSCCGGSRVCDPFWLGICGRLLSHSWQAPVHLLVGDLQTLVVAFLAGTGAPVAAPHLTPASGKSRKHVCAFTAHHLGHAWRAHKVRDGMGGGLVERARRSAQLPPGVDERTAGWGGHCADDPLDGTVSDDYVEEAPLPGNMVRAASARPGLCGVGWGL